MPTKLKLAAGLFAAAAVTTTATLVTTGTGGTAQARAATSAAGQSAAPLHWRTCPAAPAGDTYLPGTQCATVSVPLDWQHPNGRQIGIAVSRTPAKDSSDRQGVLLFNPGGPGEPGLATPAEAYAATSPAVRAALSRYDLIGFDPRGVGQSDPINCDLTPAQVLHSAPPYDLPGGAIADAAMARSIATSCARNAGALLPFMSTADTARDIDAIRAALGAPRVSMYFESYGTDLATVYDALFPGRTDRVVLDSVVDAQGQWQDQFEDDAAVMETRFNEFAARAAAEDPRLRLGATVPAVRERYLALVTRLNSTPATLDGVQVTGGLLETLLTLLLHTDTDAAGTPTPAPLLEYLEGVPGAPAAAQVGPAVAETVAELSGSSPTLSAALAVVCGDSPEPAGLAGYQAAAASDAARYPVTGGGYAEISPCAYWPARPSQPRVHASADGPRNLLLVTDSRDTQAPLAGALATRDALGARAAMVVSDGTSHILVGEHVACVDNAVASWLGAGRLPAHDEFCPAASGS
jgi:pimeloyl-ACP methyl ester carboxylesterase